MPTPRREADLLAMIDTYEAALVRIMGKPKEYAALAAHLGERPPITDAEGALRKCAVIAERALARHHPEMNAAAPPAQRAARPRKRRTA